MLRRTGHVPLAMGLAASMLLHALVLVPMLIAMMAGERSAIAIESQLRPDDVVAHEPLPERDEIQLGLDAPNPSSLTWVGYEEYLEHIAALSEIEQAAFALDPAMTVEIVEPVEVVEVMEHIEEVEVAERAKPSATPDLRQAAERVEEILEPLERFMRMLQTQMESGDPAPVAEAVAEHTSDPEPALPAEPTVPVEARPIEPDETTPVEPAPTPVTGEPGVAADKESDPTSIIDMPPEHWRLGKPLAAQGIELRPARPHWSIMQQFTARPGNPIVEISFQRDGRPLEASIIRSSGVPSVDSALLASLFRWRAAGELLEKLSDDGVFTVQIHIILNTRAVE